MNFISGPFSFLFGNSINKAPPQQTIQFNPIVRAVEIPRIPTDLFYQKTDFIQFRNAAKANNEEISENQNLIESDERGSNTIVVTNIFMRAISYLRQFFISTSASSSDPFEEDLSAPLLPPPSKEKKISIQPLDKNPWMLVFDPIFSEEISSLDPEDTPWILIRKSIINLVPEERSVFDNEDVASNTAANETVTKHTIAIWKRLKKRKELRDLEKNLETVRS